MTDLDQLDALAAAEIEAIRADLAKYPELHDGSRAGPFDPVVYASRLLATYDALVDDNRELRAAAQAVWDQAEPDDDFDGQYVDSLVPHDAMMALRAALHPEDET